MSTPEDTNEKRSVEIDEELAHDCIDLIRETMCGENLSSFTDRELDSMAGDLTEALPTDSDEDGK